MSNINTDYDLDEVLSTYRLDGSMLRSKSRVLLEDWIERIYPRIQDESTPTSTLLDIGKVLIELGDMKPKTNAQPVNTGPGFSITINIPQSEGKAPIVIEGVASTIEDDLAEADELLEATTDDLLDNCTGGIAVPDFSINDDLIGDDDG